MSEVHNDDLLLLVKKLKKYKENLYSLAPAQFAQFLKIKSNFIKEGIILTDDKLDKSTQDIMAFINESRSKVTEGGNAPRQTIDMANLISTDVQQIDEDRIEIRKHLFNDKIQIKLTHTGRMFSTQWNNKMTNCKINIPSHWLLSMDQALLLDMYEDIHKTQTVHVDSTNTNRTKLGNLVFDLLSRHSDYAIIKSIVELEFKNLSTMFIKDIDKRTFHKLQKKGFSVPVAALLLSLVEQVTSKSLSKLVIYRLLGFRTRLIQEFDLLLENK